MFANRQTEQAERAREATGRGPVRVLAVAGGKGGVGNTVVAVNLAVAAAQRQRGVWLLDASLGLGDVGALLGFAPQRSLADVLAGECALADIVVPGPFGVKIVPAASGDRRVVDLGDAGYAAVIRAFSDVAPVPEVLIVDTPAGIARGVTTLVRACQEVLIVVCDEPASITDAYMLMKVLSREHGQTRFRVLANMVEDERQGRELFEKLLKLCARFLEVTLEFTGSIPYDAQLRKAVQKQRTVVDLYPASPSAKAFVAIAGAMDEWVYPDHVDGHLQFFFERLLVPPQGARGLRA